MYRKMVGSLIYATISRPDVSYSVGSVSQFMQEPHKPHLDRVRWIIQYLAATIDYALFLCGKYPFGALWIHRCRLGW